jgi:hypothetical protein
MDVHFGFEVNHEIRIARLCADAIYVSRTPNAIISIRLMESLSLRCRRRWVIIVNLFSFHFYSAYFFFFFSFGTLPSLSHSLKMNCVIASMGEFFMLEKEMRLNDKKIFVNGKFITPMFNDDDDDRYGGRNSQTHQMKKLLRESISKKNIHVAPPRRRRME